MKVLRRTVVGVLWLLPAVLLDLGAVPHFLDGLAVDAAVPVPVYMIAQIPMPKAAYQDAVVALVQADPRDGEAAIARAEAALRGGAKPTDEVGELVQGLAQDPASARGWILLAEAWRPTDRKMAALALSQALLLAPYDYWLVGLRAQEAAQLWSELDQDAKQQAMAQTRLLWEEPLLRGQLRALLLSPQGVALATRAFADRPDEVREMNRWLSEQRRRFPITQ